MNSSYLTIRLPVFYASPIMALMVTRKRKRNLIFLLPFFLFLILLGLFVLWFEWTPPGFWGKLDSIGYAICHRIATHSFVSGAQQMPLCSRCTGMYLGAAASLIYYFSTPRKTGFPSRKILFALAGFVILFIVDGINSTMAFLSGFKALYPPMNTLRLISGSGMGIVIASALVPVFNLSIWVNSRREKILDNWGQFFYLVSVVALVDLLVLSNQPWLMSLLATVSTLTVMVILTLAYTNLFILLCRQDNAFTTSKKLLPWLLAGFFCAFVQILLMDAIRFAITKTWAGFTL
jgi:uncharacterized membrane protein